MDGVKACSLRQNGKGKFNLTNFIISNLLWATIVSAHFFVFNFIYYSQTDPCLGTFLEIKVFPIMRAMGRLLPFLATKMTF